MSTTLPALDELRLYPLFDALKPKLSTPFTGQLWLALSGGVDSVALLYLAAAAGLKPNVVHIHHGLQDQADVWLDLCQTHADHLGIKLVTTRLSLQKTSEAHAREYRYQAIFAHMQSGDTLLLGHHANDQVETLLMRLCRGTSVHGLSGIREKLEQNVDNKSITLWRPLLSTSKSALEQLANQIGLSFALDPTNHQVIADANLRAHLRAHITPKLRERFSSLEQNILRTADLMSESASILDEVCDQDLAHCRISVHVLSLGKLTQLSAARRRAVLSRFMINRSHQRPTRAKVLELEALVLSPPTSGTAIWQHQGFEYRFYAEKLYQIQKDLPPAVPLSQSICFSEGGGLHGFVASGALWHQASISGLGLSHELQSQTLKLDPPAPGSSLKLLERSGSRSVKKILQEQKIEPWLRGDCMILSFQQTPLGLLTPHEFHLSQSPFIVDKGWTLRTDQAQKIDINDDSTSVDRKLESTADHGKRIDKF